MTPQPQIREGIRDLDGHVRNYFSRAKFAVQLKVMFREAPHLT